MTPRHALEPTRYTEVAEEQLGEVRAAPDGF